MKLLFFVLVVAGAVGGWYYFSGSGQGQITCAAPSGETREMPSRRLYFEYNSTDEDTGIHGGFDSSSFAELCVYDPSGNQILAIKPRGNLRGLTMASVFFESREPTHEEVPVEEHLANFPEGTYEVRGVDFEGVGLTGVATLSHTIPAGPVITSPEDEAIVAPRGVVVRWEPVEESTTGGPVTITGYQVIVTKEVNDDPHGWSRPTYDVHVLPSQTSLSVPDEFLEPNSPYELEVLALEESGNQTISAIMFETGN